MRMGIPSCMLVCAAHRDAAQHVAEIRSTHTSRACSTGVVYVHSCMLACTYCHSNACQFTAYTPNMQAVHTCSRAAQSMYVYLHRHVCMWSTRASRAVHVYLQDANASNVRFAAHVARVCTDVRTARVCMDAHAISYVMPHTQSHTFHFPHPCQSITPLCGGRLRLFCIPL